ncbi:MAG: pyridoxal phosphate-dependent aminotransferase family protein [Actinomycetota bacterium]
MNPFDTPRRAAVGPVPEPVDLPSVDEQPRRRAADGWLDQWSAAVADLSRLKGSHPMLDAVIDEQIGRRIRVGERWLTDWASCNYLGFDLDEEIIASVPEYLAAWGTHPSWSRLLGSPRLYPEIEEQVTELVGSENALLLPTITHIHMSVIPVLVGDGTIFLDRRAHKTIYDGAMVAAGHGATVHRFKHEDLDELEGLLRASPPGAPRVIAMDGLNSMTGNSPDLRAFSRVAHEHDALLYVDDAHGFGVLGERSENERSPYGNLGNSLFRHQDVPYDNAILVAGFSKAYSSLLAFIALPTAMKDALKVLAPPYLYSGPSPVASLATTLAGLQVNRTRGDDLRAELYRMTQRVLDALDELDIATPNTSGSPIIEIPLVDHEEIDPAGRFLFDRGVYTTMAAYPLVPKNEVGFRIQMTAANTDEEIDELVSALRALKERFPLQQAHTVARTA